MKKLLIFSLVIVLLFALAGCEQTDVNKESAHSPQIEPTSESNDNQIKQLNQCAKCNRVISSGSKYIYCDGCRCRHLQGCPVVRKDGSSYCVSHACTVSGCSLERGGSDTNYCVMHYNNYNN